MFKDSRVKITLLTTLLVTFFAILATQINANAADKSSATKCQCQILVNVQSYYDKDLVENELKNHEGVSDVYLELSEHMVYVTFDTSKTNAEKLCKVIKDLGFEAKVIKDTSKL